MIFSTQFRKIIRRYIKSGYNINIIRQTACMVVNPITVNNFASLFGLSVSGERMCTILVNRLED